MIGSNDKECSNWKATRQGRHTVTSHDSARMEVCRTASRDSARGCCGVPSRALLLFCSDLTQCRFETGKWPYGGRGGHCVCDCECNRGRRSSGMRCSAEVLRSRKKFGSWTLAAALHLPASTSQYIGIRAFGTPLRIAFSAHSITYRHQPWPTSVDHALFALNGLPRRQ